MLILGAIGFGIAAMAIRFLFQSVESRLQIAVFWLLALALELVLRPSANARPRWIHVVFNGIAATIAIVAVKWSMEGLPPALR
jgi:hypothetical protein